MDMNDKNKTLSGLALRCLEQGRFAEALAGLSALRNSAGGVSASIALPGGSANDSSAPALHFNLALCYIEAEDFPAAIASLEKSLETAKRLPAPKSGGFMGGGPENSSAYKTLRTREVEKEKFLAPMEFEFPSIYPEEAKQNIIMALIRLYQKCGLEDKARSLCAVLTGSEFDNFKKLL
jgi:tetratricopeptide (TPR) repeat protein